METKNTRNTQSKGARDRLDELRELYKDGYVTEDEFKAARVNILHDEGIDVAARLQQHSYRRSFQEEDESKGCGCFLLTLMLAMSFVLGAAFFAAPYWPDRFGGAGARAAREWVTVRGNDLIIRGNDFIGGFFRDAADQRQTPDPVLSNDEQPEEDSAGVTEPASPDVPAEQPNTADESAALPQEPATPNADQADSAALPSVGIHILSLPSAAAESDVPAIEPDITIIDVETPASARLGPVSPPGVPAPYDAARGYVTVRSARIRSAPDTTTNENVLAWGNVNERFTVLEEGRGRDGSRWYHVVFEGGDKRGWISGTLVRLE